MLNVMKVQGQGLTYQWYKDGKKVESESAVLESLVVRNPEVHDTGFYAVTVSNEAGSVQSARATMIVQPDSVQASTCMKAGSAGETAGVRGGRAAARRRRMLDGAVARASQQVENSLSTPAEDTANTGSVNLQTSDSTEAERQ